MAAQRETLRPNRVENDKQDRWGALEIVALGFREHCPLCGPRHAEQHQPANQDANERARWRSYLFVENDTGSERSPRSTMCSL